jgi:hypothetical protein
MVAASPGRIEKPAVPRIGYVILGVELPGAAFEASGVAGGASEVAGVVPASEPGSKAVEAWATGRCG